MRKFFARRALAAFSRRYDYDMSYAGHMLDAAPAAFFRFMRATRAARHREAVPPHAARTAAIIGVLAEDCGPCVQLCVALAREAGMTETEIEAVLTDDRDAMRAETACAARFARALAARAPDLNEAREAVRARWGEAGVVDLTLATQVTRLYPMAKAGLGYGEACQAVEVGGRRIAPRVAPGATPAAA